ncbi:glycosyltransferase family 4 protein [Subsaximicrobium wynnwilliamsii]|uniref:glycosyltransferase family 4 protein n=1 Tax=Subsaximicrobium wynnwilliamsii TaxID=291179 RepID=UPI001CB98240|nr:glycosyltransferase family 4 protein [Subsaximicrobium wynnwilliamsii]
MYKNYLEADHHLIDIIICEPPNYDFEDVTYKFVKNNFTSKIKKKLTKEPYLEYLTNLKSIIIPNENYVVQIVDNFGLVKPLVNFLRSHNLRKSVYIQFFYHGFVPFYGNFQSRWFYDNIDEMVLLTRDSYINHLSFYTELPVIFSILHNGIDTSQFFEVSKETKQDLKNRLGINAKSVFIWCSQDRPKKGLDFIVNVWKSLGERVYDCELLVVGASRVEAIQGVKFLGRIPNDDLPKYYQVADVYLFPTLCQEGFGMSLIEALHCGCFCIASALGGVLEVLDYGKYGKLIEDPHFPNRWKDAILEYLNGSYEQTKLPKDKYSMNEWNKNMNGLIVAAKERMI